MQDNLINLADSFKIRINSYRGSSEKKHHIKEKKIADLLQFSIFMCSYVKMQYCPHPLAPATVELQLVSKKPIIIKGQANINSAF